MVHEVPQRCYQCFRPKPLCFCQSIPRIDNNTNVLILQHIGERFHPFNTARIVQRALRHCHLIAGHNQRLGRHHLPIQANSALLFPRADAPSLAELPASRRPNQLVIIDGTWHQAKTILRDVLQLQKIPCYRLAPAAPGQYRIRREPNSQSLSTLEATVAALRVLEPDTVGLEQLLAAFNQMVEGQLTHPNRHAAWRHKENRQSRPRYLPNSLLQDAGNLVVAYGESTPGRQGERAVTSLPVSWVAQRLGTAERFSCHLRQSPPLSDTILERMQLSTADFDNAVSEDQFRDLWAHFVRRNDVLVVYHHGTYQLLGHIKASQPRCLVLKSVFRQWQTGFRSIEELMAAEKVTAPDSMPQSRANQRLDLAVALVEHLRT